MPKVSPLPSTAESTATASRLRKVGVGRPYVSEEAAGGDGGEGEKSVGNGSWYMLQF